MRFVRKQICLRGHDTALVGRRKGRQCIQCDKDRYRLNKARWKDKALLLTYGIGIEKYNALLVAQGNCCAICGVDEKQLKRKLDVDHSHNTKQVRGLLCTSCNQGLGRFKDNTTYLASAIEYLSYGAPL
jgi:hypothetical protein